MPTTSPAQYGLMQAAAHGTLKGAGPSPSVAREFIQKTPGSARSSFAKSLAAKRKKKTKNNPDYA